MLSYKKVINIIGAIKIFENVVFYKLYKRNVFKNIIQFKNV